MYNDLPLRLMFHVSLLKPFINLLVSSPTGSGVEDEPRPPSEIAEDENIYRVATILDSQRRGGQLSVPC